jgi:hypothetical protein
MIDKLTALRFAYTWLSKAEDDMNFFGSALPGKLSQQLVFTMIEEHDFGWVFCYNTRRFIENGDMNFALGGNGALIVDREDGGLYITGTARSLEYYLDEYRKGNRTPVEHAN